MAGLKEATLEMTDKAETLPPSIKHLFCSCQVDLPEKVAYCGRALGSRTYNRHLLGPVELCVLCLDIEDSGGTCAKCGANL